MSCPSWLLCRPSQLDAGATAADVILDGAWAAAAGCRSRW